MKKHLLFTLLGVLTCYSCSNSYDLLENDMELAKAAADYEVSTRSMEENADTAKIETVADEETIQKLMDDYVTELMNRTSIAKEKVMRTVYSASNDVVGVFKIGSCGVYTELEVNIDAEDTKQNSKSEGLIGDSYIDSNGNVRLKFCLTEASQYYPGGVFLVNHINYYRPGFSFNHPWMKIVARYHDCDDKHTDNRVVSANPDYDEKSDISNGYTKIDDNAVLAWAFPDVLGVPSTIARGSLGPKSRINYGVICGSPLATMGKIHFDDEDSSNKNWAKLYTGNTFTKDLLSDHFYGEYGLNTGKNTWYSLTFSTDLSYFKNKNRYHPGMVMAN